MTSDFHSVFKCVDLGACNLASLGTKSHTVLTDIGTNTHANIDSKLGYLLAFMEGVAASPADASTYYIAQLAGLTGTQGMSRVWIPFAGTVTKIYGHFFQIVGSAETSTLSLLHNGATLSTISSTLDHSASVTTFSKTDLAQAVVAGDYLELKWVTPTWVTNPTFLRAFATAWVAT